MSNSLIFREHVSQTIKLYVSWEKKTLYIDFSLKNKSIFKVIIVNS